MKLLFFTKYTEKGASSRYRSYQYMSFFKEYHIEIYPFFDNQYNPSRSLNFFNDFLYVFGRYLNRFKRMININSKDVVFLEYEFLPYLPFNLLFFKLFKINYIVDYDDAIFHNYDLHRNKLVRYILKNKISNVIKYSQAVITGSPYLTNYAKKFSANVIEIPTSINSQKYQDIKTKKLNNEFVIGWIGSKTTSINLISLIPAFKAFKKLHGNFEIRCIGFDKILEHHFKDLPFHIVDWDPEREIEEIKKFTVGIMPLENTPFNRGKCAFKLIQYMACGIPTISTPLEANIKVNRNNSNLFANTTEDWVNAFVKIYKNIRILNKIGEANKKIVENYYSVQSNKESYLKIIESIFVKNKI